MTDKNVLIENLPDVRDIDVLLEAIQGIGARVERVDRHTVGTNAGDIKEASVDDNYIRKIRASYYFIGALLGKYESVQVPLPGGCNIDSKLTDLHIKGFRALEAKVDIERGAILAYAIDLVGSHIYLDKVSVGATINTMVAAALAEGQITIENTAKEPHAVNATNFLDNIEASIKGAGVDIIRIKDVRKLHETEYFIAPDQTEAGTFMCAVAMTRDDITTKSVVPRRMEAISTELIGIGCEVVEFDDAIRVIGKPRQGHININTLPYPGLSTDMQPQMTVALALTNGTSIVTGNIFEDRFKYVDELMHIGNSIKVGSNVAVIDGVKGFTGAQMNTPDLRTGATLAIAGLAAEGCTTVDEIGYIQRGYKRFEEKLKALGAITELVDSEKETQKFESKTG